MQLRVRAWAGLGPCRAAGRDRARVPRSGHEAVNAFPAEQALPARPAD